MLNIDRESKRLLRLDVISLHRSSGHHPSAHRGVDPIFARATWTDSQTYLATHIHLYSYVRYVYIYVYVYSCARVCVPSEQM